MFKKEVTRNPEIKNRRFYDISIITPLHNEERNIKQHFNQITESLNSLKRDYQLIFVNDGSTDLSEQILYEIQKANNNVTVINLFRKKGKAAALEVGIGYSNSEYVVIIDSDLQYDSADMLLMISELDNGYDLVSGKRMSRQDLKSVILTSSIFNVILRKLTGLYFEDYFSGLKCFKKQVVDYLSLYGDLYRFSSVYAFKQGFKVKEIPISHYQRNFGSSKYNSLKRIGMGFLDIITILMTVTFNEDRVYYLALVGALCLSAGVILICLNIIYGTATYNSIFIGGVVLVAFGILTFVLKKVSHDFFDKHQKDRIKRASNLKNILSSD